MISERARSIGFSPTLAVSDLASRMRAEGIDVLDFSAGQPDFPTPDRVKEAAKRALDANQTRYTANAGLPELRRAIVDRLERDLDLSYSADQVLVSPGAKASLYFAFQAMLNDGDEVLVPTPYWTSYPEQIRLAGAKPVFVECTEQTGFKLGPDQLTAAVTPRTRAVLLNYPSNPTGVCYSRADLEPLAEVCLERGLWIVADEIYSKLLYDGLRFASVAELDPEVRERSVLIDGVSKTYAMTGWRIGYAAGPTGLISAMSKLQSHSTSNATSISQWASVEALAMSDDELAPRRQELERRRDELIGRLGEIDGVSCVRPEGAFYAFPNFASCFTQSVRSGQELAKYLLEKARVAVVPGEAFGAGEHLRLSYACSLDQIGEGMSRLSTAIAELHSA